MKNERTSASSWFEIFYSMADKERSMDERIGHLYSPAFRTHDAPENVLKYFNDVKTLGEALYVAVTFRNRLGDIAIARRASKQYRRMLTIMDRVIMLRKYLNPLLVEAFTKIGFRHSVMLDDKKLTEIYLSDPIYARM